MTRKVSSTRVQRVVDLSVVVDAHTRIYPGDPKPDLSVATTITTHGYNLLALRLGSQTGTHVDSPYHFKAEGPRLEGCDLSLFVGSGLILDLHGRAARERITWQDIEPQIGALGTRKIVALHTGWSERHLESDRYFDHPFLDGDACLRLLDRGVRTFLIDAINLDETVLDEREPDFSCHHHIAAAGGIISENITNLSAVDWPDPVLSLLPIRLGGDADGAPCRAVALLVE
jgi:kynurenine formamidase